MTPDGGRLFSPTQAQRKADLERRKSLKIEADKRAQEAIEKDLASRPKPDPRGPVWINEHQLPETKPLEFAQGSAVLPADAHASLARVAKELMNSASLKLHIAGHVQVWKARPRPHHAF